MTSILKPLSTALLGTLLLSGCVLDEDNDGYNVDIKVGDVVKGVAEVTVTVSGDGVAEGQSINVTPHMRMVDADDNTTMEHGTPFSVNEGLLDENGQFKTTAYFLMGSKNMNGEKAGDWSINIEYNDATENFPITVDMMMSDKKSLTDAEQNQFFIFDLGRRMDSFSVYISARETMFDYSPVTDTATVEMCAANDCDSNSNSWKLAEEGNAGEYKAMGFGLAGDDTDKIQVRLTVDNAAQPLTSSAFSFTSMSGM